MDEVVHKDQKGFIRGRNIFENILEMIEAQEGMKGEEMALLLDFKKAFDSLSHEILEEVFKK